MPLAPSPARRTKLPVWLLGAGFLPVGLSVAVMLIAVPQLLAANHVPEHSIAMVSAFGFSPSFLSMPLLPLLDWRLKRQTYAIILVTLTAACMMGALLVTDDLPLLCGFLFVGAMGFSLLAAAVGGWFGDLVQTTEKDALSAWFNVYNFGGGGAAAVATIFLLRSLGPVAGAILIAIAVLAVVPLYVMVPCPPASRKLAHEGFRDFARDVGQLLRRRDVLWILLMFIAPSASFSLTNTMGGVGRDFAASEQLVGIMCGTGAAAAGILGCFLVPRLTGRISPIPLYLLIGAVGAVFTLSLTLVPHSAVTFGVAVFGENLFQAAAFTTVSAIALRAIGRDNPLAATQFGVLVGSAQIPLIYMLVLDGQAYKLAGINGSFVADALLSATACLVFAGLLWSTRRHASAI